MGQPLQKHKHLSSRELREIAKQDGDRPSLLAFVVIESFEWLFVALLLFLVCVITRPIWQPVVDLVFKIVAVI